MKIIKIFILGWVCMINSYGYSGLPTSNALWKVEWSGSFCQDYCGIDEYVIENDTIIGAYTYSKVYKYTKEHFDQYATKSYFGAIRNSLNEKKVYSVYANNTDEIVLYDFDVSLGDTIEVLSDSAVIRSIDSILLDGKYLVRLNLSSLDSNDINSVSNYSIIDGIGSTNGLFEGPGYSNVNYYSSELICFKENGNPMYYNNLDNCNSIFSSIFEQKNNDFKIYPNPSNGKFTVIISKSFKSNRINVYNTVGKKVYSRIIENRKTLDLKHLQKGIYMIEIISPEQTIHKKIIIR